MSRLVKIGLGLLGVGVLVVGFVVQDWYRFATSGEIDANRGVYGNDHLEVWIDLNLMMPNAMRKWGCKTLLDRESVIMGGQSAVPPYGCQPDYDPDAAPMTMADAMMSSYAVSAGLSADAKNATPAQKDQVIACVKTGMTTAITPDQATALNGTPGADLLTEVNLAMGKVKEDCLAKAGL